MKVLLDKEKLLVSDVVANNRMNRGRGCLGQNSYRKDLSFDPIDFLKKRLSAGASVSWLDICCGEGRALIEAAKVLTDFEQTKKHRPELRITGIDLAGMFGDHPVELNCLKLLEMPIEDFTPRGQFDLITCVHGLHYIGDKLSVIRKAARWLKETGVFLANFEVKSLKLVGKENSGRRFAGFLKAQGFALDQRKRLLSLQGTRTFELPFEYVAADDQAGPNYTGQPAVDSYYQEHGAKIK